MIMVIVVVLIITVFIKPVIMIMTIMIINDSPMVNHHDQYDQQVCCCEHKPARVIAIFIKRMIMIIPIIIVLSSLFSPGMLLRAQASQGKWLLPMDCKMHHGDEVALPELKKAKLLREKNGLVPEQRNINTYVI